MAPLIPVCSYLKLQHYEYYCCGREKKQALKQNEKDQTVTKCVITEYCCIRDDTMASTKDRKTLHEANTLFVPDITQVLEVRESYPYVMVLLHRYVRIRHYSCTIHRVLVRTPIRSKMWNSIYRIE